MPLRFTDKFDELYGFQKVGVKFLVGRTAALLADDMGTGKSVQAITACQHVGADNILVICPASIKYNWLKEFVKWGFSAGDVLIIDKSTIRKAEEHNGIFIVNYDLIHRKQYAKVLARKRYDVLICDECHHIKERKALRTKAVLNAGGYADRALYKWMLSGTPVLNRPVELHGILRKLYPNGIGEFINYIRFTQRYCAGHEGKWGWDATGATNVEELAGRLSGFMLRRNRDLLTDLPDRIIRPVYTPITKEIESHLFQERSGNESARRLLGIAKIKAGAEYVRELLNEETKVVVFAYHTDVINGLREELSLFVPAVIQGSVSAKMRQKEIDRFVNESSCRVFIGQIDAAGEGIDGLQGAARHVVFVELSYVPGKNLQAIGRVHRNGQKHKVMVDFYMVEGSNDERVFNTNMAKAETIKTLMQDARTGFDNVNKPNITKETEMEEKDLNHKDVSVTLTVKMNDYSKEGVIKMASLMEEFGTMVNIGMTFGVCTAQSQAVEPETPVVEPTYEPIVDTPPAKPKRTRRTKKQMQESVVVDEIPVAPAPVEAPAIPDGGMLIPFDYVGYVQQVANTISTKVGSADPSKINELFAQINTKFRTMFPKYTQVFDVTSQDEQLKVKAMLDTFLKEQGLV